MSNPLLNSSFFGAPSNGAQAQPTNLFGDLLANAKNLNGTPNGQNGHVQLPSINLGIGEIERQSESVIGRGKGRQARAGEGHTLLARFGVNTNSTAQRIEDLSGSQAGPSAEPERPRRRRRAPEAYGGQSHPITRAAQGDIGAWGRSWHEMVILEGIETQRRNTIDAFNKQFQTRMSNQWEEEKKRVLQNELGVTQDELADGSGLGRSVLGQSQRRFPFAQSTSKSAESTQGGLVMHTRLLKYARTVEHINQSRLARRSMDVCQMFQQAVKDDSSPQVREAFNLIAHLVHEPSAIPGERPVAERQYQKAYLAEARTNDKRRLNQKIVKGAKNYLEKDFEGFMETAITNNSRIASLGGQPGISSKVRGYTTIVLHSKDTEAKFHPETVNGLPLYAHVYYLLRSGHASDAIALLEANQHNVKREDSALPGCVKAAFEDSATESRLSRGQRDQLMNDFNAHVRSNPTVDQYKYALYKLAGRFDLGRKNIKVAESREDWIWVQLMLVREAGNIEDGQTEKYDLEDFGKAVQGYGSGRFDAEGQRPFNWATLLLCAGEFEAAVGYLWTKSQYRPDAVHLAIALSYYGLLRISEAPDAEIIFTRNTGFEYGSWLNFYRMVAGYVAPWAQAEPETALQYAYLVALNGDLPAPLGQQQKQLALEMVREIVLKSRQWGKLLGSVRPDGSKQPGLIERDLKLLSLQDTQEYIHAVILSAADQSSVNASLVDSIELYHLAGSHDRVIDAVTRALAHSLSLHGSARSIQLGQRLGLQGAFGSSEDILQLAETVGQVYQRDSAAKQSVEQKKWDALEVLVVLKRAMTEYAAGRLDSALTLFKQSEILPLMATDPTSISRFAARFATLLDNPAVSDLDEVVITTMKCIHRLSTQLRESPYGDSGRMQRMQELKLSAQALIQFASGLRLRLGGDVYRQLSSMSAFL